VVTTADAGGVLEFVRDGENGFVAPAGSLDELADRFDRLFDDRALASRLGRAGASSVRSIGWDLVVDRLLGTL
jgi:glycosyltransferase involved in cell wall biosynthesis